MDIRKTPLTAGSRKKGETDEEDCMRKAGLLWPSSSHTYASSVEVPITAPSRSWETGPLSRRRRANVLYRRRGPSVPTHSLKCMLPSCATSSSRRIGGGGTFLHYSLLPYSLSLFIGIFSLPLSRSEQWWLSLIAFRIRAAIDSSLPPKKRL